MTIASGRFTISFKPSSDVINQEFIFFAVELIIEAKRQYCDVKIMRPSKTRGILMPDNVEKYPANPRGDGLWWN